MNFSEEFEKADDIASDGAYPDGGPRVAARPVVRAEPLRNPPVARNPETTSAKAGPSPLAGAASSDSAFLSASESELELVEEDVVDEEVEPMTDAGEEVVAAAPKLKRSISDIDWTEARFKPRPKRNRLAWIALLALGALGLVLVFLGLSQGQSPDSVAANETVATPEVEPSKRGASDFPNPPASLPPARVRTPKSLSDLRIGDFVVNPRRAGDDLIVISGDIENVSDNLHRRIRVELDLLDAQGLKVATANPFVTELAPRATWHVLAPTTNTRAVSARLTGIKEDL